MSSALASLAALITTVIVYAAYSRVKKRYTFPIGPPQWPLVGNLFDMPTVNPWIKYSEWSQQYESDMIYLNVAGTHLVLLNTLETVLDLFEKRGSIYSSRVRLPMVNELMGWDFLLVLMPYGDTWKDHRRLFHQEFLSKGADRFRPEQTKAANRLLRRLLDSPDQWQAHLKHHAGSLIMEVTYGIEVLPENDPHLKAAEAALLSLHPASRPGAFLVDTFPILKNLPDWAPGAGFKRKAKEWKILADAMVSMPWRTVKKAMDDGSAKPSFSSYCLQKIDASRDDIDYQELVIKNTAGTMYSGTFDSSVSTMSNFFLAMVKYPDVQDKAQAELDTTLEHGRLPTFEDRDSLPYLSALVKELLRWAPAAPLAIAHTSNKDDMYRGYTFPSGTIFMPNTWSILHDEKQYPDPFTFTPDRFLTSDGQLDPAVQDPELAAFGYGRRKCPGKDMAMGSLWITIGTILAAFKIERTINEKGELVDPLVTHSSGLIR